MRSVLSFTIRIIFVACFLGESTVLKERSNKLPRIVGGEEASPNSWPWQVSIQAKKPVLFDWRRHICGGTLINKEWVLSAAHCFVSEEVLKETKKYNLTVIAVLGAHDWMSSGQKFEITNYSHPLFNDSLSINDISLLKLLPPLKNFTRKIRNISLPSQDSRVGLGTECWITGWERSDQPGSEYLTIPPRLKQLRVNVMNQTQCAERIARLDHVKPDIGITVQKYLRIYENKVMCVISKNASACFGDSGGPLVCKENGHWVLRSLASFILSKTTCPRGLPNIYTRVSNYVDWINLFMKSQATE